LVVALVRWKFQRQHLLADDVYVEREGHVQSKYCQDIQSQELVQLLFGIIHSRRKGEGDGREE
jgi:hypothetical protein